MKNITLIGYRCTGKTEVGKEVAKALEFRFIDTDEWIEKDAGITISQLVSKYGWQEFREIEKKVIHRASGQQNAVICTGGGAIINSENTQNLKKNSIVFWLGARPEIILKRMQNDKKTDTQRPDLTGRDDTLKEIEETLKERIEKYESASDCKIDTSDITKEEVTEKILKIYKHITKKRAGGGSRTDSTQDKGV